MPPRELLAATTLEQLARRHQIPRGDADPSYCG
jgi:hypothetical protein